MTPAVPDGPDTELAAAVAYFRARDPYFGLHREDPAQVHAATIVRAVLARPTAVQPRPADDPLRLAVGRYVDHGPAGPWKSQLNEALIQDARPAPRELAARPAVARTDGQPPADERALLTDVVQRLRQLSTICGNDEQVTALADRVVAHRDRSAAPADDTVAPGAYIATLIRADEQDQHDSVDPEVGGPTPEYLRGYRAGVERSAEVAAEALPVPVDDTAAPDPDHTTEYRAVMAGYGTGSHGDLDSLRRVYRPQIESGEIWIESRTVSPWTRMPDAGQPVRDSQSD